MPGYAEHDASGPVKLYPKTRCQPPRGVVPADPGNSRALAVFHRIIISTMKRSIFLLILTSLLTIAGCGNTNKPLHVMVVAGGHDFDTVEFVEMFRGISGITFDTVMQPRANRLIAEGRVAGYDAIVFYDMWNEAGEDVRNGYHSLPAEGTGLVFLHHSLAGYPDWEGFSSIIGGRYITPGSGADTSLHSTYRHDLQLEIGVIDPDHPVTRSVPDFRIRDEGYGNIMINPDVTLLLKTDHPDCAKYVGWTHIIEESRIVYLMSGHDRHAYTNENFQKLLRNAMMYVSQ